MKVEAKPLVDLNSIREVLLIWSGEQESELNEEETLLEKAEDKPAVEDSELSVSE